MKVYAADFETTVYDGQERTDVWAAAIAELNTDNVELFGNIYDFWQYICKQRGNCRVYFHNLKFCSISLSLKCNTFKQQTELMTIH